MKLKSWSLCFGVLCALAAGRADAAKYSFSDKGFIDVGVLVQGQFRMEQDSSPDGKGPSYDFLMRRARIIISGQFDEHIGYFFDTDITYGAPSTTFTAAATGAVTRSGWDFNMYVLDAVAIYKVNRSLIIDAGLTLLPYSHNSLTNPATLMAINGTWAGAGGAPPGPYWAPNNNRGFRDVGIVIRGLLLDDRLYYRLGVFNGVQGLKNTSTTSTSNGLNPGDAPNFAGMLRFNIAGKEEGYGFCQLCFAASPIVSIGVAADVQPNSFRGTAPTGTLTAAIPVGGGGGFPWANYNVDVFADIPFGNDMEFALDAVGQLVKGPDAACTVNGTSTTCATASSGWGINALATVRFGPIAPYVGFEYFNSDTQYVGITKTSPTGTATNFFAGDFKTYRGGLAYYFAKHNYKIAAEIAFQDKENAGNVITATYPTTPTPTTQTLGTVPPNHWVGTLQFQAYF